MARLSHGSALAWCLFGVALFVACGDDSPVEPDTDVDDVDPITRAEAITAARSVYLDGIASANFTVASMGMTALPAGTHIQINHGDDHPVIETVLERESYFALVDRIPAAGLPHPFTYLFIDAETGQVTTDEAFYPPLINGVPTYTTYEERTDAAHRFEPEDLDAPRPPDLGWVFQFESEAGGASPLESTSPSAPPLPLTTPARQYREGGQRLVISINGGRDDFLENTVDEFDEAMAEAGFETVTLDSEDYELGVCAAEAQAAGQDGSGVCGDVADWGHDGLGRGVADESGWLGGRREGRAGVPRSFHRRDGVGHGALRRPGGCAAA